MASTPSEAAPSVPAPAPAERRRNAALRALIDEMLFQVRDLQQDRKAWTPDERATAEAELARIMDRVRAAAVPPAGGTDQTT